jgi:hypothetical protein
MVARPRELMGTRLDMIDADTEQLMITGAMEQLERDKKVKLCWTTYGTTWELNRRLHKPDDGKAWNVFHFIGHGGFDEESGQGFIIIQEDGGARGIPLYAEDLRGMLAGPQEPQLVVLNSCSGAQSQSGDLFSSTAAHLTLGRIPAVVAMQFEISDDMAKAFSRLFYSYLADGDGVRTALILTRLDLKTNGFAEWIAPVLYMRTPDKPLFPASGSGTQDLAG